MLSSNPSLPPSPLRSPDPVRSQCQQQYWELLQVLTLTRNPNLSSYVDEPKYVRKFLNTRGCDFHLDLGEERKELETYLGPERVQRIQNHTSNPEDTQIVHQAVIHHRFMHRDRLLEGISWRKWLTYPGFLFINT